MSKCIYCGRELGAEKFCLSCGAPATKNNEDTKRPIYFKNDVTTNDIQNNKQLKGGLVGFGITLCTHFFGMGILGLILCLCLGDSKCKKASVITFLVPIIIIIAIFFFVASNWR